MICEIKGYELLKIIDNNKLVGRGVYGMVYEYDDNTLIKIYYKDILRFFCSRNIEDLDKEVDINLYVENEMKEMRVDYVTKLDRLNNVVKSLNRADCSLIKGIVLYRGYPIGILLTNYKDYSKLGDSFKVLDTQSKSLIMDKIKLKLSKLFSYGIYPLDLKEDNILVNIDNLDVQFIDLDGGETRYEDSEYIDKFHHIKDNAIMAFDLMEQRLQRK